MKIQKLKFDETGDYKEPPLEWLSSWISAIYWRIKQWFQRRMKRKLTITTLDGTWHDRDEVLLNAAFQVLVNYYNEEKPREHHYFEYSDEVIDSLYVWWTKFRPLRIEPFENKYFEEIPKKGKEFSKLLDMAAKIEDGYEKEDQEKFKLLVEHRRCMWT